MGCNKNSSKRKVYSNTSLPQETRQISNNLTLHLKQLEKEKTKPKASRRKENVFLCLVKAFHFSNVIQR